MRNNKVTVIPASRTISQAEDSHTELRVAAYCRVSTDSEEQALSYDTQISHYTNYIGQHPGWRFAGIYADEGITGTSTRNRVEFHKMIDDCRAGRLDMVVTKSISRFARNTLDCLKYIRLLKNLGIAIYFEKENINTLDASGEILITIMASLAQQESESLSQNVRLGLEYRYQQGIVRTPRIFGYDKDVNKNLIINSEEAPIVRRIFHEYLAGASYREIARGLSEDGFLTLTGKTAWHPDTIRRILTNEKYMGDALLQKTYSVDCINNKRKRNNGERPQYYVESSHPAIVSREVWAAVQKERARRNKNDISAGNRDVVFHGFCDDV